MQGLLFRPKFSLLIVMFFILFTIIGTLSHELGHIIVAEYFGYDTEISYGSMSYKYLGFEDDELLKEIEAITEKYGIDDYNDWPEKSKLKIEHLNKKLQEKYPYNKLHDLAIALGGPLQTILTSLIGLIVLYFRRKVQNEGFKFIDWLAVFLSLFILREVFNFFTALYKRTVLGVSNYNGDEFLISRLLGYSEWLIPSIALMMGLLISLVVIFKFIPFKYRFSFVISGFIGGLVGYGIWFGFLGEMIFN
jgi:hypothetical protein